MKVIWIVMCSACMTLLEQWPHHFSRWLRDRECSFSREDHRLLEWFVPKIGMTQYFELSCHSPTLSPTYMIPPRIILLWYHRAYHARGRSLCCHLTKISFGSWGIIRLTWHDDFGAFRGPPQGPPETASLLVQLAIALQQLDAETEPVSWFPGRAVQVAANFLKKSQQDYKPDDPQIASNFDARRVEGRKGLVTGSRSVFHSLPEAG